MDAPPFFNMLIVTTNIGFQAEKTYACTVLLGELLGVAWEIRFQPDEPHYRLTLPNGAVLTVEDHFFGKQIGDSYLHVGQVPENPVVLPHPFEAGGSVVGIYGRLFFAQETDAATCGLDLFASAFFMLTRWEEAVRPERDAYGRFPATAALAVRGGFLDRPVVHEYADLLEHMFARLGWPIQRQKPAARLHFSCDVDHPRLWWSAADRLRTLGGSLWQRRNPAEALWWLRHGMFRRRDPFDVFEQWMYALEKNDVTGHFNFMGERPRTSDCYYPIRHPVVRNLIRRMAIRGHVVGFHPSREAHADAAVFDRELESLRAVCPTPVTTGRQHYLCFEAPDTWQRWADAGMAWDSTLGYPESEGFRCGMCCDFPVFNFRTRQLLPLREKPLLAMDVTFARYRRYTPMQARERIAHLHREVKKHGGELVLLWHNSSWDDYFWKDWQSVVPFGL